MMPVVIPTLAIQLLVCSSFVAAAHFSKDRFETDPGSELSEPFETRDDITAAASGKKPLSLSDILNQRVNSKADLCPTLNVMLFFRTGNMEFLRECYTSALTNYNAKRPDAKETSSMTASPGQSHRAPVMASYSGRLLKRILQNIGDGPAKIDFTREDGQKSAAVKRAPLSINSALSSLVDMLRYETAGQEHGPKYAFHTDMLHVG